jgi:hypothetical protein
VFEVNPIYFILLAEGFVLLLIILLIWVLITLVSRRRRRMELARFASTIKKRAPQRSERSQSFLGAVYQLEDEDMRVALAEIDKSETDFLHELVNILNRVSADRFIALEASLEGLIKSYKCMQPRVESDSNETSEEIQLKINHLLGENESLRDELSTANSKLGDLINEFGEIFGGGKEHQLTLQEVIDKVDTMKADHESGAPFRAQK